MDYKGFNKKYNLTDDNVYDAKLIERLNAIVNGRHLDKTNTDSVESLYAGNYERHVTEDYELAEKYYLMAIDKNHINVKAMNNIALLYKEQKKYRFAEKYYLMAIEHNYIKAMYGVANIYKKQKKYALAEKYYLMAIEHNYVKAMNGVAIMYFDLDRESDGYFYALQAISHGSEMALDDLDQRVPGLKLYMMLTSISEKNQLIINKMKELEKNRTIRFIGNKIRLLGKESECPVCFEIKLTIPRECAHTYCLDCYIKIRECAMGCDK